MTCVTLEEAALDSWRGAKAVWWLEVEVGGRGVLPAPVAAVGARGGAVPSPDTPLDTDRYASSLKPRERRLGKGERPLECAGGGARGQRNLPLTSHGGEQCVVEGFSCRDAS